jgi:hypothetical protein
MVLYQHQTNRKGEPWITTKRAQFARALEGQAEVHEATSPEIARDVAFFWAVKRT